jgi:hypothetical protein
MLQFLSKNSAWIFRGLDQNTYHNEDCSSELKGVKKKDGLAMPCTNSCSTGTILMPIKYPVRNGKKKTNSQPNTKLRNIPLSV